MNMKKYPIEIQEILDTINLFDTVQDKIDVLVNYAESFTEVPKSIAAHPFPQTNKVEYCESEAYVWVIKLDEGKFELYFAVDNPGGISAKALCSILQKTLSGKDAMTILSVNSDLVFELFGTKISMGKNLGLTGIIRMIHSQVKKML